MSRFRYSILIGLCALPLCIASALAGPIADFEAAFSTAYADYRAALFRTNQTDRAASDSAITAFGEKWRDLTARWAAVPPPHLSEDAEWKTTLGRVSKVVETAKGESAAGDLAKAHETLEKIRDEISAMRARNGLVSFSDYMNAYHETMEEVLSNKDRSLAEPTLGTLHEQAAVLSYLSKSIRRNAGPHLSGDQAFLQAFGALEKSVSALLEATRARDGAASKKALDGLKPAYSRMFLRFG